MDWVRQQGLSADDDLAYMREFGHITLARILLAQCDDRSVEKVHELLNRLLDAAEQGGREVPSKSWYCRHSLAGCWATSPRHWYRLNAH